VWNDGIGTIDPLRAVGARRIGQVDGISIEKFKFPEPRMTAPDPYLTLGVPNTSDDAAIRAAYLKLTVQFPPEQHPERFEQIRTAYETIRTLQARALYALNVEPMQGSLDDLEADVAKTAMRPRPTLEQLLGTFRKDLA
jgi:DnaJ domain